MKINLRKRLFSLLLCSVMILGLVPITALASTTEETNWVKVNSTDEIVPNARYIIVGEYTNPTTEEVSYHIMGKDCYTNGGYRMSYAQEQFGAKIFDISEDLSTITTYKYLESGYDPLMKIRMRPYSYFPGAYYFLVDGGYMCGFASSTNKGSVGHDAHSCMPVFEYTYSTAGDPYWYLRMPEADSEYAGDWQIVARCKFRTGGSSTYQHDVIQMGVPYPNSGGQFRAEEVYTRDVGSIEDSERIRYTVDKNTNIRLYREVCTHKASEVSYSAAVDPSCTQAGNKQYWYCAGCEQYSSRSDFSEKLELAESFLAPLPHSESCGHSGEELRFEPYKDTWTSSDMDGDRFLMVGKANGKYYAMGNLTAPDGTRNAVEVSINENGILTANSKDAEFLTYDYDAFGFAVDDAYLSAMDGRIIAYDKSVKGSTDFIPIPLRFSVDDSETGLGSAFAWSGRDMVDEYVDFDEENLCFRAQSETSENLYFFRELCRHEKWHTPAREATCTRCGNVEYWYCDTCYKYFGAEDGSILLDEYALNQHAFEHSYADGVCENCSKKVPVYQKITSEDQLGQSGTYIIVATDGTKTFVLQMPEDPWADKDQNGIPDLEEIDEDQNGVPDYYEKDSDGNGIPDCEDYEYYEPLVIPVVPNADGSITVEGLGAAEFEMIEGWVYGWEDVPMEASEDFVEDEVPEGDGFPEGGGGYYFYVPNYLLNGLNEVSCREVCFVNGEALEAYDETSVWGISFGNALSSQEQQDLANAQYTVNEDNAVLYAENCGNGARCALRLRLYNGQYSFVTEYDSWLPGATEALDEEGNVIYDEDGYTVYDTHDTQYGVYLYYAPDEYDHIHQWSDWKQADENTHSRTCSAEGCKIVTETKAHVWDKGVETKAPACGEEGEMTYTCTDCGATKTESMDALEHAWSDWAYADDGVHVRECERNCGVAKQSEAHSWSAWTTAGESTHKRSCPVCKEEQESEHSFTEKVTKEPSHLEEGEKTFTCSVCGHSYTKAIAKSEGHEWSQWAPDADAKTHSRSCVCGESETLSHKWSEWDEQEDGSFLRQCECGAEETMVLDEDKPVNSTPADNAANSNLTDSDVELITKVLTDEEQSQVADGADVKIYLKVEDVTEDAPATHVAEAQAKAGDSQIGMYLDIDLFKQVGEAAETPVSETSDTVTITITIPDELVNKDASVNRVYKIIRVHELADGVLQVDEIEGIFDPADNSFTFETDKFSTYALAYDDEESFVLGDGNGDGSVTFADIQRIYQHLSTSNKLAGTALQAADANKDGSVTFSDIQRIYQHLSTDNKLF